MVITLLCGVGCKEDAAGRGAIEVKSLDLVGVHAFPARDLLNVLATHATGRLPFARPEYFNRADFEADLRRIQAYYADHGYPSARVTDVDAQLNDARDAVRLTVTVDEGAPIVVDDVRYEGFDVILSAGRQTLASAPLRPGGVRDHDAVKVTRDLATRLFHDAGYPDVYIDAGERPAGQPNHVLITFRADPGPKMVFGDVTIDGLQNVDEAVVRRELAFKTGATFRSSQVLRTQHRLERLDVFSVVSVSPRVEEASGDRVPVRVTVAEAKPRQVKVGIGYGSEEQVRATVDWRHVNFLGGARAFEVDTKASFIDRGVKFNFLEPYLGRAGLSLNLTGVLWKTQQLTYDSETYGGRATVSFHHEARLGAGRPPVRFQLDTAYIHEYLRYGVTADALADQSNRAQLIAMGLDPTTGRGAGTLAGLDFDATTNIVDSQTDPRRGISLSVHFEHAAPWLFGSYRFDEFGADVRGYVPVGPAVLAARGHAGSIFAGPPASVPFSKLYFLGGAISERGWGRFEISPLDADGNPIGGRTFAEGSIELRVPMTPKLGLVGFLDMGDVRQGSGDFRSLHPRFDLGAGVRYYTPVGLVRVDVGQQLNPIPGLRVNGSPETRHWRIHFSIGQAF
jgi:outer membrane protein assembly complex protein YaeT